MNKKLFIAMAMAAVMTLTASSAFAESTIYTDDLGRMHFLGRDAANNTGVNANFTNSEEQDLTRKLYEGYGSGLSNDTSFDQHPLKNYENTFSDSRFNTTNVWRTKYANNTNEAQVSNKKSDTVKGTMTFEKGVKDASNAQGFSSTNIDDPTIKANMKKHWWNRNK